MTYEEILKNLEYVREKHKDDRVNFGGTNIVEMAISLIIFIKDQQKKLQKKDEEIAKLEAEIEDRERNSIEQHSEVHYWRDKARELEKERKVGCEHCQAGVEIQNYFDIREEYRNHELYGYDKFGCECSANIYFCPICGYDLTK